MSSVPVSQIPEADKTSSTSQPLASEPALTMDPYKIPPQSNPLANHPALDMNVLAQPPQLRTPLASEPADQWATSTIQAVADDSIGASSTVSTPGPQIPGAYPSLLPSAETVQKDLEFAKEVAASALNTATTYASQAGQTVAAALSSAKQPATEVAQSAAQTASQAAANTANATAPVVKAAGRTAADGANVLVSTAVSAGQSTVEGAKNVGQAAAQTASNAAQTTANTARSTGQSAANTAVSAGQTTASTAQSAGNTVASAGNTVVSGVTAAPKVAVDTVKAAPEVVSNTVKAVPEVAVETAKSAGSTVGETVRSVGATVGSYLPAGIASYLPGNSTTAHHDETAIKPFEAHSTAVTDPTGNMKNGLEALDGTSFAKLPEEAMVESHKSTAIADPTGNSKNGLEGVKGVAVAKLPEERNTAALPSHDDDDEHGKVSVGGVGALPGRRSEEGVARLPEERRKEDGVGIVGAVPYESGTQSKGFGASYLNPNLVLAPEPSTAAPNAIPNAEGSVDGASTHHPAGTGKPYEAHHLGGGGADTDASIRSLAGSSITGGPTAGIDHSAIGTAVKDPSHGVVDANFGKEHEHHDAHRGTFENKPLNESLRGGVDPHVERLRARDVEKGGKGEAVGGEKKERERAFGGYEGMGESKPVHESERHPSVPPKDRSSVVSTGTSATAGTTATTATTATAGTTASEDSGSGSGSGSSGGKKGGSGFMSRVKGEMKVLSGRLTHKEEKVEEGRRMLGKN